MYSKQVEDYVGQVIRPRGMSEVKAVKKESDIVAPRLMKGRSSEKKMNQFKIKGVSSFGDEREVKLFDVIPQSPVKKSEKLIKPILQKSTSIPKLYMKKLKKNRKISPRPPLHTQTSRQLLTFSSSNVDLNMIREKNEDILPKKTINPNDYKKIMKKRKPKANNKSMAIRDKTLKRMKTSRAKIRASQILVKQNLEYTQVQNNIRIKSSRNLEGSRQSSVKTNLTLSQSRSMEKMNQSLQKISFKNDSILMNFKPSVVKYTDKNGKKVAPSQPLQTERLNDRIKILNTKMRYVLQPNEVLNPMDLLHGTTHVEMIEEEQLYFRIYTFGYKPPLVIHKKHCKGKIRIYISSEHYKPKYGNAEVVFSEHKSKLLFYPKKCKKHCELDIENVYITLHSLSVSSIDLEVYFKSRDESREDSNALGGLMFKPLNITMEQRHRAFINDLMDHPKRRKDFMEKCKDIRRSRVERLRKNRTLEYKISNQSYEQRRKDVLQKKEQEWKLKLFTVFKKEIKHDLQAKLKMSRNKILQQQYRNKFWVRSMCLNSCFTEMWSRFVEARDQWIHKNRKHIAARRIGIHWKRYMIKKGEIMFYRQVMHIRHSFKYKFNSIVHKPDFSGTVLWSFYDFLRKKAWRHELKSKMIKYNLAVISIQEHTKAVVEERLHKVFILKYYWKKVRETIAFLYNHPKHQKKLKKTVLAKIHLDETVDMDQRVRKYVREFSSALKDKRKQFFDSCSQNKVKGILAKFVYNLVQVKKEKNSLHEIDMIDLYLEEAVEKLTQPSKKVKSYLGSIRQTQKNLNKDLLSLKTISSKNFMENFNIPERLTLDLQKKKAHSVVTRDRRRTTLNNSLMLPPDMRNSLFQNADQMDPLDENSIVNTILGNLGEDIKILNEQDYLPDFRKMLALMLPEDDIPATKRSPVRKKPQSLVRK
ncbi:unnamed protein product [Moneuplotes crassus]|uniref:Uncharacterized protein n=3 Tax=Euplotes crassus TaxID=5936 RepID=A0AAD1XUQ8_EUPCR|nr:unnamed protein product [Moneuplotes crassus]